MIRLLTGVAALALPAAAMAQADGDAVDEPIILYHPTIEMIVVTAGGALTPSLSDEVQDVTLIRDLAPGLGARVENRLRDEAGIVQFRRSDGRSAHPTSQGVTLRGLGGNASSRAIVLLDGVPQADPFGGWIAWPSFDSVRLAGVRITRGGGSGVDGPGALAGTIALSSSTTNGAIGSAAWGSRDGFDLSGSAGFSRGCETGSDAGCGSAAIDARFAGGDGFVPIVEGQRGPVDRAARFRQGGGGVRVQAYTGDTGRVEASIRGFYDERDRGTAFTDSRSRGIDASIRYLIDPTPYDGWQASFLAYVQIREFDTGFASVAAGRNSVAPALDQHVPATGIGARVELRPDVSGDNPLRTGIDWRRTVGRTEEGFFYTGLVPGRRRSAGGSSDTLGAFAEWTGGEAGDRFIWTASGRIDRWWIGEGFRLERNIGGSTITDARFAARQGWEASGRAGFRWKPDRIALRGAVYRDWRLPTLNELYRPFRVGPDATAANEALKPERLWGGEIGVEWNPDGSAVYGVTLFANRLENAIANVTLGVGPGNFPGVGFVAAGATYSQRQNLDAITSLGIEASAEQQIGPVTLRATYAFTDANVDASGAALALDGERPAQIAKHGGSVSLRSNDDGPFGGFATLRYIGKQNEDDLGMLELGDALTLDAGLSWKFSDAVSIEARGENLFDELVPAAISSSGIVERATPRTLWVGVRTTF